MSGPSALVFLVMGGLMFGGCAVAVSAAADILAAFVLLPIVCWTIGKAIEARGARPEPEPVAEAMVVERLVGTVYVCRIIKDGQTHELAAESLPELQRLATRAIGAPTRLEIGR